MSSIIKGVLNLLELFVYPTEVLTSKDEKSSFVERRLSTVIVEGYFSFKKVVWEKANTFFLILCEGCFCSKVFIVLVFLDLRMKLVNGHFFCSLGGKQ